MNKAVLGENDHVREQFTWVGRGCSGGGRGFDGREPGEGVWGRGRVPGRGRWSVSSRRRVLRLRVLWRWILRRALLSVSGRLRSAASGEFARTRGRVWTSGLLRATPVRYPGVLSPRRGVLPAELWVLAWRVWGPLALSRRPFVWTLRRRPDHPNHETEDATGFVHLILQRYVLVLRRRVERIIVGRVQMPSR